MEQKIKNVNEKFLFHGTSATNVQAICQKNFVWRFCGKNGSSFGEGIYFARDAASSDCYSEGRDAVQTHWMFRARVLLGRYIHGRRRLMRPPPIDENEPHGDLYDSCVNRLPNPSIYVVFEDDQCYPEYVIHYSRGI